jgi:hypothetical protein
LWTLPLTWTCEMKTLKGLLFLALAAVLVGCPKPKPPTPPTPTPTPVAEMPAPGVPVAPEALLRQAGGKLLGEVQVVGAVQCCEPLTQSGPGSKMRLRKPKALKLGGVEINSRWPQAGEPWQDYTAKYGVNTWDARSIYC